MNLEAELAAYKVLFAYLIKTHSGSIHIPKTEVEKYLGKDQGIKIEEVDGIYIFSLGEQGDTI